MYLTGSGVSKDDFEVAKWAEKAARQGHTEAQNNIGRLYEEGQGVPQNKVQAYFWYSLAAARGNETAKKNRAAIAQQMSAEQIAEADRLVSDWKPAPQYRAP